MLAEVQNFAYYIDIEVTPYFSATGSTVTSDRPKRKRNLQSSVIKHAIKSILHDDNVHYHKKNINQSIIDDSKNLNLYA